MTSAIRAQRNDLRVTAFVNRETAAVGHGFWHDAADDTVVLSAASAVDRRRWAVGEFMMLPRAAARERVDVLHCPANFAPLHGPFARVVTLHDLVFRRLPDTVPTLVRWGTEATVPWGVRRAHRIITGSDAARDDIVAELKLQHELIDVVPHGIAPVPSVPAAAVARMREKLAGGGRPIALSVATDVPHKNLAVLLRGLALLEPEQRPLLVFVGFGTDAGELPGLVGELGLAGDVRVLGAVAHDDLEALYAQADVLVTATLYEGFGLPVLEAMARGVLVACSDLAVLREVAGEQAEMLDPHEPASIAAALRRLLSGDADLDRRREAGRERAARYTWSAAATQTLRVFDEAVEAKKRR